MRLIITFNEGRRWGRWWLTWAGRQEQGLPAYAAVPHLRGGTDNLFHYSAYLGGGADPFVVEADPNEKSYQVKHLSLPGNLSIDRLGDRRRMLERLDGLRRDHETRFWTWTHTRGGPSTC